MTTGAIVMMILSFCLIFGGFICATIRLQHVSKLEDSEDESL